MLQKRGSFLLIGVLAVVCIGAISLFASSFFSARKNSPSGGPQRACTLEAMLCPDGTAVGRTGPNCEFAPCPSPTAPTTSACATPNLTIDRPQPGVKVSFPLIVSGTVDNRANKDCSWTIFEVQAATVTVKEVNSGAVIGQGVLTASGEWMTEGPVAVKGQVTLSKQPMTSSLMMIITEDDPSGMGSPQEISIPLTLE